MSRLINPPRIRLVLWLFVCALDVGRLSGAAQAPARGGEGFMTAREAFDDIDVLMRTLAAVHPHLNFRATPQELAALRAKAEAKLAHDLTRQEFFAAVDPLVRAVGEKHTRLFPPQPVTAEDTAKGPNYRWKFEILPDGIGYLDFVAMDSSGRREWDVFLEKTFAAIREQGLRSLIVDLRRNGGGDSRLGDDLLSYLTDRPYRALTQKTWRLSHLYLRSADFGRFLDGFNSDDTKRELQGSPTSEQVAYFSQNPSVEFKALLAARLSPAASEVLRARAPHWLDLSYSPETTSEWLRQGFPAVTPPGDWPLRFRGRICFLVGPETFSSAVILADAVKEARLATIIGEETQPCNQFGELYVFSLPQSRLTVWVPSAQYVRANGDATDPHGVIPDLVVHSTSDLRADVDPVLAAARRWAAQ